MNTNPTVEVTPLFVTAGKAIFTIHNDSGVYYTYYVESWRPSSLEAFEKPLLLTKLLTGPNNYRDYTYLGMMDRDTLQTRVTSRSKVTPESKPMLVINWAMEKLLHQENLPPGYGVRAEGRCGACLKRLTAEPGVNPEGYRFGLGPVCYARLVGKRK